jgi:hypothetical protein
MQRIHSIHEFDGYDVVLVYLKADGTGETRIHIRGSTGNIFDRNTWAATVGDAKARHADPANDLKTILVLLDDGVVWDPKLGTLN